MDINNLFSGLVFDPETELADRLFETEGFRVERIASSGQTSPVYDQEEHEWVLVLQGNADILLLDQEETRTLRTGDHLFIPAHMRHQVTRTSADCLWLCVFWRP